MIVHAEVRALRGVLACREDMKNCLFKQFCSLGRMISVIRGKSATPVDASSLIIASSARSSLFLQVNTCSCSMVECGRGQVHVNYVRDLTKLQLYSSLWSHLTRSSSSTEASRIGQDLLGRRMPTPSRLEGGVVRERCALRPAKGKICGHRCLTLPVYTETYRVLNEGTESRRFRVSITR